MKGYVVGEVAYEYNDEVMHRPYGCDDAVKPIKVYKFIENAEREARRLHFEQLVKITDDENSYHGLSSYGYDTNEIFKKMGVLEELLRKYSLLEKDQEMKDLEVTQIAGKYIKLLKRNGLQDVELVIALSCCKVQFFEVYEVEVGDE